MSPSLMSLVGFAAWAVLLVLTVGTMRVLEVLTGQKRSNEFPSGVPHGGDRYWRINRAHINAVENLPIFAALVLTGAVAHVASPRFDQLAVVVLGARVLQSLVHISSGRSIAVNVRFSFYVVQLCCFI